MRTRRRKRAATYWIASTILFTLFCAALWFGYVGGVSWIGFSEYHNPKPVVTTNGQNVDSFEVQRAKTLWDWLQLLVIPTVLAAGGFLLNERVKEREASAALDAQREAALQKYFDAVSDLLLRPSSPEITATAATDSKNGERADPWDVEISPIIASLIRARTLTTLTMLDPKRKGSLIRFLLDAYLLQHYPSRKNRPIDLTGADLRDADLTRLSLRNVRLRNVDLTGADLRWCELKDAVVDESTKLDQKWQLVSDVVNRYHTLGRDLRNADLRDAHLGEARLSGFDLRGTNLSGAVLDLAHLDDTKINWRTRLDSKWKLVWQCVNQRDLNVNLEGIDLSRATLSIANFTDKSLARAQLFETDLSFTTLVRTNFEGSTAIWAKFQKSTLTDARLANASLQAADFTEADLQDTNFEKAHCFLAHFEGAKINAAKFTEADCQGANFSKAIADGTSFEQADLRGAAFFDVDLSKARDITSEQLADTLGDAATVLPPTLKRPSHWSGRVLTSEERKALIKARSLT
jgi:uncharacterized protein YjbI with pentapeptide repeats